MALGNLVGAFYNLDVSRARAYCALQWVWVGVVRTFYSPLSCLSSASLSLGDGLI